MRVARNISRRISPAFGILLILTAATAVRLWGIDFGLPNERCRPDESIIVQTALGLGRGDLNPHFFYYPSLFFYVLFFFYGLYYLYGRLTGAFQNPLDVAVQYYMDPTVFYLIPRLLSVFSGVVTVYLIYKICDRFINRRVALIAAMLLALAPLHVRDSHFGVTDISMCAFIMASVWFTLNYHRSGRWRHALLAAASAGLAVSTKYNGLLAMLPLFLVLFYARRKELKFPIKEMALKGFYLSLVFVAVFILTSPYALLDFHTFIKDLSYELRHLSQGHEGILLGRGWLQHIRFSLFHGLGWWQLIVSAVGIFILIRRYKRFAWILLTFPIVYYLLIGRGYTVFARYALPLFPFCAITAAAAIEAFSELLAKRFPRAPVAAFAVFLTAIIVLPSAWRVLQIDRLLAKQDSRLAAAEWMMNHIPNGASIYQHASAWEKVRLYPSPDSLQQMARHFAEMNHNSDAYISSRRALIIKTKGLPYYETAHYVNDSFTICNHTSEALPDLILIAHSFYPVRPELPERIQRLLQSKYHLAFHVPAAEPFDARNRYDLQDAFFIPLAGFHNIRRLGPDLYLYQKNADGK
ncbi:glycosyltransferase family 39 protein [candidate division KSB1 bacterium]|nr:glycosyltransferase family 39 protein [candidate division KSB1 bacterium]